LKGKEVFGFMRKKGVGFELNGVPAYLPVFGWSDLGTKYFCHQLSSKAEAQGRNFRAEKLSQDSLLVFEPRVKSLLVHIHSAPANNNS
jgi:hypothetical protein